MVLYLFAGMKERKQFYFNLGFTMSILLLCWLIKSWEVWFGVDFGYWGILPRHWIGLRGILFSPVLHGDWTHLISNSLPYLVLTLVLLNAYPTVGFRVFGLLYLVSGFLVWAFAFHVAFHIGMSGVIYGMAAFLLVSGLVRRDRQSTSIGIFVALMYGGMLFGFIPMQGVSWESHAYGAFTGLVLAWLYRNRDLPERVVEIEESELDERHFFERFPDGDENKKPV